MALTEIPMKKGSDAVTISMDMRGSIEDISKIICFKVTDCKLTKKISIQLRIEIFYYRFYQLRIFLKS